MERSTEDKEFRRAALDLARATVEADNDRARSVVLAFMTEQFRDANMAEQITMSMEPTAIVCCKIKGYPSKIMEMIAQRRGIKYVSHYEKDPEEAILKALAEERPDSVLIFTHARKIIGGGIMEFLIIECNKRGIMSVPFFQGGAPRKKEPKSATPSSRGAGKSRGTGTSAQRSASDSSRKKVSTRRKATQSRPKKTVRRTSPSPKSSGKKEARVEDQPRS